MSRSGMTTKTGSKVHIRPPACRLDGTPKRGMRTWYAGVCFRSRLESLWARAFDAAGLRWSYEPMEYVLGNRTYLPDFYLADLDAYAEVKPVFPDPVEYALCSALRLESGCGVYVLIGHPDAGDCLNFCIREFCGRDVAVGLPSPGPLCAPRIAVLGFRAEGSHEWVS
jgi:hypothetical protein